MIYFTADLHFDHDNIIRYCDRPFNSRNHMNAALISKWNSIVTPEDKVFVLGDYSLTDNKQQIKKWTSKLNGEKHLILGNHDMLKAFDYVDCGFSSVHTALQLEDNIFLAHDPAIKTALPKDSWLLHGHIHNLWKENINKKLINVGVDVWDYKPVSIETLKKLMLSE